MPSSGRFVQSVSCSNGIFSGAPQPGAKLTSHGPVSSTGAATVGTFNARTLPSANFNS